MSDVGLYAALETELKTLIENSGAGSGLASVTSSLSPEALISIDGIRKPCVGIGDAGMEAIRMLSVGSREMEARVTFQLWTVFECARTEDGNAEARGLARPVVERLRDAIHGTVSGISRTKWVWEGDAFLPVENDLFVVYESRYSLTVIAGRSAPVGD